MFIQRLQQRRVRGIGKGSWYFSSIPEEKQIDHAIAMAKETLMELKWDLGFGIWDLGFGIWDLGFGIWDKNYI